LALGEDVQHLAPDIAGRADHDHPVSHHSSPQELPRALTRKRRRDAIWRPRAEGARWQGRDPD
jgi:hypothetical protein